MDALTVKTFTELSQDATFAQKLVDQDSSMYLQKFDAAQVHSITAVPLEFRDSDNALWHRYTVTIVTRGEPVAAWLEAARNSMAALETSFLMLSSQVQQLRTETLRAKEAVDVIAEKIREDEMNRLQARAW